MLITLGLFYFIFWFQMQLPLPQFPQKVSIGHGTTFAIAPQCGYRGKQARTPIYLGRRPETSKSCGHECVGFEQPFGPILSQWKKAIPRPKRHVNLNLEMLQVVLRYTPKVLKLALVKLASIHILELIDMIVWGVRSILLNV